jgi:hypothetical protein
MAFSTTFNISFERSVGRTLTRARHATQAAIPRLLVRAGIVNVGWQKLPAAEITRQFNFPFPAAPRNEKKTD